MVAITEADSDRGAGDCSGPNLQTSPVQYLHKLSRTGEVLGLLARKYNWEYVTFVFDETDFSGEIPVLSM